MKIYTKTGDKGETSLVGGSRIKKNHIRLEAYGTVDELNAHIGMIRDMNTEKKTKTTLLHVQNQLFTLASQLALEPDKTKRTYDCENMGAILASDIQLLEQEMDQLSEKLPPLKHFVLPGGHPLVSQCHVARTVCRRAERKVLSLSEEAEVDSLLIQFINRLSDYLFVLGRHYATELHAEEIKWIPKK